MLIGKFDSKIGPKLYLSLSNNVEKVGNFSKGDKNNGQRIFNIFISIIKNIRLEMFSQEIRNIDLRLIKTDHIHECVYIYTTR